MAVRGLGCPVRFTLTAGQKGDAPQAAALIEGQLGRLAIDRHAGILGCALEGLPGLADDVLYAVTAPSAAMRKAWDWSAMSAANSRLRWAALSKPTGPITSSSRSSQADLAVASRA